MLPRRHALWGGLIAPLLWTGFLWALLALRNPVLAARVDWSWFVVSQIAFGLVAGFVVARANEASTAVSALKAGTETSPRANDACARAKHWRDC